MAQMRAELSLRRRRLVLWRVAAIAALVLAVMAGSWPRQAHVVVGPHLVKLKLSGVIAADAGRVAAIDAARRDPMVRGMLLEIDSPGGTVSGGVVLHDALARFSASKPLVTVMDDLAASAAYMAASPSTRIFANAGTLTGSIGVLMQAPDFSGLLGKLGIGVDMLVSGPLKGQPSGVQPLSPAGREMLQGIIDDYYGQFVDMVASGRHMPVDRVRALADGRPYTARQALANGLIDQIGGQTEARDWLAANRHLPTSLRLVALSRPDRRRRHGWVWQVTHAGAADGDDEADDQDGDRSSGRAALGGLLWQAVVPAATRTAIEARLLSGPVAIWQP